MTVYLDVVMLLNFIIDLLLLAGTNRLSGFPVAWGRTALGAALGGVYAGCCLIPGFRFMGNFLWRTVSLALMGAIAFGVSRSAARRCMLFVLLAMALGGVAVGIGSGGVTGVLAGAAVLFFLCSTGFRGAPGSREYAAVELNWGGKRQSLLALRDTGNTLRDPVTGQSVLVVNAQVAHSLLGLTRQQLLSPVETVAAGVCPGLRLIPYRSVGQPGGMLAAIRMENVRIGKWQGSTLVAFAPAGLDAEGTYQALTGGIT